MISYPFFKCFCLFVIVLIILSIYLCIYGGAGYLLLRRLSLVAASRSVTLILVSRLLVAVVSLVVEHGLGGSIVAASRL